MISVLAASAVAFSPAAHLAGQVTVQAPRTSVPLCVESGRRAALFNGAALVTGAAAISALPRAAYADAIEDIAAKANAKAMKEREEELEKKSGGIKEVSNDEKLKPILYALGASVVLSVPFYFQNLERLATKVASGGKDSGYEKKGGKGRKQAKVAKGVDGKKFAKQAAMSLFKVKID